MFSVSRGNSSVALIIVLLFAGTLQAESKNIAQPRRIFILDLELGAGIQTTKRELITRIEQEMPRNILLQRALTFEDISSYSDIQKWNPKDFFLIRKPDYVQEFLRSKQMRMMLTFSLSYAPGAEPNERLLLSGRLYDLDLLNCLLIFDNPMHKGTLQSHFCNVKKGDSISPSGVTDATVDLPNFGQLPQGLRHLFARLFHIPQIIMPAPTHMDFINGEKVQTNFEIVTNRVDIGTAPWLYSNNKITAKQSSKQTNVIDANADDRLSIDALVYESHRGNGDQICRDPEMYVERPKELDGHIVLGHRPFWAKIIPKDELKIDANVWPEDLQRQGTGFVEFRSKPYDADYILKIRAVAKERLPDGSTKLIPSFPVYRCIYAREPRFYVGIAFSSGGTLSYTHPEKVKADTGGIIGIELYLGRTVLAPRSTFSGLTWRRFNMPFRIHSDLLLGANFFQGIPASVQISLRGQLRLDLLEFERTAFSIIGELGIAARRTDAGPGDQIAWGGDIPFGVGLGARFGTSADNPLNLMVLWHYSLPVIGSTEISIPESWLVARVSADFGVRHRSH